MPLPCRSRIRFAAIQMDTLNLDESSLEGLISTKTRLSSCSLRRCGCEMEEICTVGEKHDIAIIDNAHGLFNKYRGKPLRTFGRMAT